MFVQVLEEEDMAGNAARMGVVLEKELASLDSNIVTSFRGRGLFWGVIIKNNKGDSKALSLPSGGVACSGE